MTINVRSTVVYAIRPASVVSFLVDPVRASRWWSDPAEPDGGAVVGIGIGLWGATRRPSQQVGE